MYKYLRRRSCQVHRGIAKIWPNHRIDESGDEELFDGATCKICKIPWIELTEKSGYWSQCDICDEYIWLKGHSKRDMSADNNFLFVAFSSDHNYQSQIFIQLSTRALNYAMKLSTVIESLLISIH